MDSQSQLSWVTPLVALLALAQPWLIHVWKRLFRRGLPKVYESGRLEIGFSGFGATIGVSGTLRTLHREVFVKNISVTLTRKKDSAKHHFDWALFRRQKLSMDGKTLGEFELPYGFMLLPSMPRRFDIQFHDTALRADIQSVLTKLQSGLLAFLRDKTPTEASLVELLSRRDVYEEFSKSGDHVSAFSELTRLYYWEPGEYELDLVVETAQPDRAYKKSWLFELSKSDTESVRLNILRALGEACSQVQPGAYSFAYPEYRARRG